MARVYAADTREDIIFEGDEGLISINMAARPAAGPSLSNNAELYARHVDGVPIPDVTLLSAGTAIRRVLRVLTAAIT